MAPYGGRRARGDEERFRVGKLEVEFDGSLIASDERWREAVIDLFVRGAEIFRAFFAAAQVAPGWIVSRSNRPYAQAASLQESEHFLRGRLWQGLPPVPVWLSWYGDPYRKLVQDALRAEPQPPAERKTASFLKRLIGCEDGRTGLDEPEVAEREAGTFVRLGREPLPRPQLPRLPLPQALTYRERRAIDYPGGGRGSNPAQPEDRASVIPDLEAGASPSRA
jgi:hypothetical protein